MIETDAGHAPFEVDDLDVDGLLWVLEDAELQERAAVRRKLRYAYHWCVLHPGRPDDHMVAGEGEWGAAARCDEHIAGEGTPWVTAGAAVAFAAGLGIATVSGQAWLADALDLRLRLPRMWALVESLEVQPWKARRVATLTRPLPKVAAAWVDEQLAPRLAGVGLPTIDKTVTEAIAAFCPELLAEREKRGRAAWTVQLDHCVAAGGWDGTSALTAWGDTKDLTEFHDLVCAIAVRLGEDGDTDTYDQRKAKALGIIARGEHEVPPAGPSTAAEDTSDSGSSGDAAGTGTSLKPSRRRPGAPTKVYLHLKAEDVRAQMGDGTAEADTSSPRLGTVERLGPATLDLIKTWLGHGRFTVTPVIDLSSGDGAVDRHDPPAWMREAVFLRDPHCVFPWCACDARSCDLDHMEPYDPRGEPGQTTPERLAPLCRRHHNAKTHFRWRYHRAPDGTYVWTSPRGRVYLVTPDDTLATA